MASLGGGNSASIKAAIDSIFQQGSEDNGNQNGAIPLGGNREKVVSATADGANVNLGVYSGVLTQMKQERDWLFKNSGKLKAEVKKASEALDITHYTLPKIHGTRFLNHRRRGLAKLLHNWPSYIVAFDNALASRKGYTLETKAKVAGFSKKFKSYPFLCKVAGYLDVFEKYDLLAFEIPLAVETVIDTLEEIKENSSSSDYVLSSYLAKFRVLQDSDAIAVKANYPKAGHERRQPENRELFDLELEQMSNVGYEAGEKALEMQVKVADILCPLIRNRFSSYDHEVFKTMTWIDPKYWDSSDKNNGKEDILRVCEIFSEPLEAVSFNKGKVFGEWRSLKNPPEVAVS